MAVSLTNDIKQTAKASAAGRLLGTGPSDSAPFPWRELVTADVVGSLAGAALNPATANQDMAGFASFAEGKIKREITATTGTIQNDDRGKIIECTNAAGCTLTVPDGIAVGFTDIWAHTAGVVTLDGSANISINGTTTPSVDLDTGVNAFARLIVLEAGTPRICRLLGDVAATQLVDDQVDFQDNVLERPVLKDAAVTYFDAGAKSGAASFDYRNGHWQRFNITGTITGMTITNPPASGAAGWLLFEIVQDPSTNFSITWGAAYRFVGGTDFTPAAANTSNMALARTRSGGSVWYVFDQGKNFLP